MKRATAFSLLLTFGATLISLLLILPGCMGEPPEDMTLQELLLHGKDHLEKNEGAIAYNFFKDATRIAPDNETALYGITLANDLRMFANIDGIIDILTGVFIYYPSLDECTDACAKLTECDLLDEAWTTEEECLQDCPFGLQPFMFDTLIDGSSCEHILDYGLEWIVPTPTDWCVDICNDLDLCGKINPPVTFDVEECIEHCPRAYVERHSKCYMEHLGECNGYDRTCFEHVTVGLQILFRDIGKHIPVQALEYSDTLLAMPDDYQYYLETFKFILTDPPLEIDLDGRYSHGFVHLSQTVSHAMEAFFLLATSVKLEMNFPSFDLHFNYGNPEGAEEIITNLISTLEVLLYDPIFPFGFQVADEDWAIPQIQEGGIELGLLFDSLIKTFDYMLNDHDLQQGKALGYNDENQNFIWDDGETMTLRGPDVEITRAQVVAIRDLSQELRDNFIDRDPIDVSVLKTVLLSFDLGDLNFIVDLLDVWYENGEVDFSELFYNPQKNDFRDLLEVIIVKLEVILELIQDMG